MKKEKFVDVTIKIEKEDLFKLCMIAHRKDVTLNQLVREILREYLDNTTLPVYEEK